MLSRIVIISLFSIIIVFLSLYKMKYDKMDFTCTGQYKSTIDFHGQKVENLSNVIINVSTNKKIIMHVEGVVNANDKSYHLSRNVFFTYEFVDSDEGLLRVTSTTVSVSSLDTAKWDRLNNFILGAETGGRLIKIWKLNDGVLLVGNPFSPVFNCIINK